MKIDNVLKITFWKSIEMFLKLLLLWSSVTLCGQPWPRGVRRRADNAVWIRYRSCWQQQVFGAFLRRNFGTCGRDWNFVRTRSQSGPAGWNGKNVSDALVFQRCTGRGSLNQMYRASSMDISFYSFICSFYYKILCLTTISKV